MYSPALRRLRNSSGAFDLPSIITGVVVVGILTAGVLAAIFGVIPFAQDRGAKQDLSSIRNAEGVARAKDNRFMDHQGLLDVGYLQMSSAETTKVKADEKGTCYVALAKSGTGKTFYATDASTDPELFEADTDPGCLTDEELAELIEDVGGVEDETPADAPANLKLTAVSPLQAKAAWDWVEGATGYKVEYRINDGPWIAHAEKQGSTVAHISSLPEQAVTVKVTALLATGSSAPATATLRLPDSTIKNPSFELGAESWSLSGYASVASDNAHTGTKALKINGSGVGFSQTVVIPVDKPVLSYWATQPLRVQWGSTLLASGPHTTEGAWTQYKVDVSAYAGKAHSLNFNALRSGTTYVDDVALEAATTPGAPTAAGATSRSGGATVAWTNPAFSGGTPITSYTATALLNGEAMASTEVAADLRTATIPGLNVGFDYTFTLTANNALGSSEPAKTGAVTILAGAIANPSFELGAESWSLSGYASVASDNAHTGTKALKINGSGVGFSQTVVIPVDKPVLSYWATQPLRVQWGGTLLASVPHTTDGAWTQYKVDVSAYAGKAHSLNFNALRHGTTYVDDVAFEAK